MQCKIPAIKTENLKIPMCDGLAPHKKVYPNIGLFSILNREGLAPHNNVSTGDEQFYIG